MKAKKLFLLIITIIISLSVSSQYKLDVDVLNMTSDGNYICSGYIKNMGTGTLQSFSFTVAPGPYSNGTVGFALTSPNWKLIYLRVGHDSGNIPVADWAGWVNCQTASPKDVYSGSGPYNYVELNTFSNYNGSKYYQYVVN